MRRLLVVTVALLASLVAANWIVEFRTEGRANEVKSTLQECAPIGRSRVDTEKALAASGLEHVYGVSDNIIYGKKEVGRYRLLYSTEVIYKVHLDDKAQVTRVESIMFNEGL
jgi:hypothetical protein